MRVAADPPVSVTTGNTGQGIDALINRTTDIAAASNEITPAQMQRAKKNQVQLKRFVVARDCIAVIVNPANPIKDLSLEQLRGILTGAVSNWSQVGGQHAAIKLLIRESTSGTQSFLCDHYLKGSQFAKNAQTLLSLNSVIDSVSKDKTAVGYVGMSGAVGAGEKVKVLALKVLPTSKAVKPSPVSTFDDYPLSRPLALYTDENAKPSVDQFVNYCLSPAGQKVASESGFATVHKAGD